jgi:predicted NBD/HSP70 family sugar kinase
MPPSIDLLQPTPAVIPPLDHGFSPVALANQKYAAAVTAAPRCDPVAIALEGHDGQVTVHRADVFPPDSAHAAVTVRHLERLVKFLLWQVGGWRLTFAGPAAYGEALAGIYSVSGARAFDVRLMQTVFDRPFRFEIVPFAAAPAAHSTRKVLGGQLEGCRIGFDLGASDYKLAAVREGEVVFTTELPWDPKNEADPSVHYQTIQTGLELAARHLPRVDAIGGSAAGIYVDNEVKVASLFRSVPPALFESRVRPLFRELQRAWGVPLEVANDGDVTALAAAMALRIKAVLGIAMGSSEAAGYLDRQGCITGWLNELAFAPVDHQQSAPADEWSGDLGVGAQYFSQQAVGRLLKPAGIQLDPHTPLPEKLRFVQSLMQGGDTRAERIYQTMGVYLGYALAQYAQMYDLDHVLILGRVTTGPGADIMVSRARSVLETEFPEWAGRLGLHLPDEKTKRVGQAVAAASLPRL